MFRLWLASASPLEGPLLLSLDTRQVGRVTIVRCQGRIVAGKESESLRSHISGLLQDRRSILLHLGEVGFVDSSGLGTMVRAHANTRQARGDLKLCNVPDHLLKVLQMTRLTSVFDLHDSEETALAAFYHRPASSTEAAAPRGANILCLDSNVDVLAYLREFLRRAGYEVQTTDRISDAMLLMKVTPIDLLLVGPDKVASAASPPAFQNACAKIPVVELGADFSTRHAGDASAALLSTIEQRLNARLS
jgi:anti-sigma B factor antagonist